MKSPSMLRGLLSFSSMTMVSRVLGLLRDISISHVFGANVATDAFWVAFRIPNFMRRMFAEGAFSTAFVPVFTQVKEKGTHAQLKELMSHTAGTLSGVLLTAAALGVLFAPQVASVFTPGAVDEPETFSLTVQLLRLTFPYLLFISLTALAGGALNSFHRFGVPALTPVILNLCIIVAAWWLSKRLQTPILALGWAVLAAGLLQVLFQLPALRRLDLLVWPRWGWRHHEVRRMMRHMLPTLFGSSVLQINLLIDTSVASLLMSGSQTWLSQADRFLELPLGVFGVALGTVILPSLSRHHLATDQSGFSKALDWGLRTTLLMAVPAMFGLMLLAQPLVSTLYQNGQFRPFDTRMAALSVTALSFGVPAYALVKVLLPAFYARKDTRTPVRAGVVALLSNMLLNGVFLLMLYRLWAPMALKAGPLLDGLPEVPGLHLALGMASAVASYVNLGLLWLGLRRAGIYQPRPGWRGYLIRLAVACTAMVTLLLLGRWYWPDWTALPVAGRIGRLALLVGAGGLTYMAVLFAAGFRLRDLRHE